MLARDAETFDQSKGTTKGLSLYLVSRTGADGKPNGVTVTRLEEKLGIHGSPTAAMQYDHAEGFLVGERGQGFTAMLSLMNNARLGVAAEHGRDAGVAPGERHDAERAPGAVPPPFAARTLHPEARRRG